MNTRLTVTSFPSQRLHQNRLRNVQLNQASNHKTWLDPLIPHCPRQRMPTHDSVCISNEEHGYGCWWTKANKYIQITLKRLNLSSFTKSWQLTTNHLDMWIEIKSLTKTLTQCKDRLLVSGEIIVKLNGVFFKSEIPFTYTQHTTCYTIQPRPYTYTSSP